MWPKALHPFVFILNVTVNLFWIVTSWPGTFTGDSVMVLSQIKTGFWNDWHPLPYTVYYSVITLGGNFPGLGTLIQVILFNISIILFVKTVTKRSLNFAFVVTTFLLVTPYIGPYGVTAWKDVPYVTFTILGIIELLKLFTPDKRNFSKWKAFFYLVLGSSMRHDGPITLFASAVIFLLVAFLFFRSSSRQQKKSKLEYLSASKTLVWASIFSLGIQLVSPALLGATPKEGAMISMSFLRDLAHVAKNDETFLEASEYDLIRSFSDETSWSFADDCVGPNGYLGPLNFDFKKAGQNSLEIFGIWLRHFFSGDALKLLEARSCNLSSFSLPIFFSNKPNEQTLWTACRTGEVALSDLNSVPAGNNVKTNSLSYTLKENVCDWSKYFGWPILFSISGILAACVLFYRTRRMETLLWGSVILGRSVILYVFSVAQDFRYALLIHLIAITLVINVLLDFLHRSNTPKD